MLHIKCCKIKSAYQVGEKGISIFIHKPTYTRNGKFSQNYQKYPNGPSIQHSRD
jgi:hypothetical protein